MMLDGIHRLIDTTAAETANFPLTLIYNEGWLLRLVIDWYSKHPIPDHPLLFHPNATWFSEALLPSPFKPRYRSDPRAEAPTHADAIIGHFSIGSHGKADVKALPDAAQLIIIEAKIYSSLSGGTRHAPGFDQAARNVACITEILYRANRAPSKLASLAFFLAAPEAQIKSGVFTQKLDKAAIRAAVLERAKAFSPELDGWTAEWFTPTLEAIRIEALSWESILHTIASRDQETFRWLQEFYERCLQYNRPGVRLAPG